ncbi:ABC transporter permease [Pseudohoeflea coraliihabitans]|uniref:ABC transporter permease n=1 Tax=Pseudohoeflea coraliihabitans TaxID=2860393 RepID=A0ABS6WMT2_9HYPH|nr:ABC transporter permease [Pseudohoeflea sp. DP4N28-3]MBW3097262.1 ABC transporter permease [Pseudohoeflea sp. DP4N28-3]
MPGALTNAFADLAEGYEKRRVWWALAREDIGDQHRRTTLGPFWLLFNYMTFAGTFIFVFRSSSSGSDHYPTYVAVGLLVWLYIMETITQAMTVFVREKSFIKGTRLPLTVYVMRLAMQSVIRTLYALAGCVIILLLAGDSIHVGWLLALPGVLLLLLATPGAILVFGFLGAYVPDSQFFVANIMRIGMFLTPVFWRLETAGGGVRSLFYHWNPFTYFLEIVRQPMLNQSMPLLALGICAIITVVLWLIGLLLLGTLRRKLVFVL